MQVPNEREQHRLLSEIERMHREGRSEAEIVETMNQIGGRGRSQARPAAGAGDDARKN